MADATETSDREIPIKYPLHIVAKDLGDLFGAEFVSTTDENCTLLLGPNSVIPAENPDMRNTFARKIKVNRAANGKKRFNYWYRPPEFIIDWEFGTSFMQVIPDKAALQRAVSKFYTSDALLAIQQNAKIVTLKNESAAQKDSYIRACISAQIAAAIQQCMAFQIHFPDDEHGIQIRDLEARWKTYILSEAANGINMTFRGK